LGYLPIYDLLVWRDLFFSFISTWLLVQIGGFAAEITSSYPVITMTSKIFSKKKSHHAQKYSSDWPIAPPMHHPIQYPVSLSQAAAGFMPAGQVKSRG
jgi:hypothetical protein